MRAWIAAAAAFVLAACGQTETPPQAGAQPGEPGQVTLGATQILPDWLMVARTADGGFVFFNQRTIVRNADGTADVWVQIQHGRQQLYGTQGATIETTVRYNLERLRYRFNCSNDRFLILTRQFMGPNDTVAASQEMQTDYWRVVPVRGPAGIVRPIACRGR